MKKVALVTGASSGIGKETAKLLAQKGFTVYGAARRVEKMTDLEAEGVKLLSMDVTNEESMVKGVNEILQHELVEHYTNLYNESIEKIKS